MHKRKEIRIQAEEIGFVKVIIKYASQEEQIIEKIWGTKHIKDCSPQCPKEYRHGDSKQLSRLCNITLGE